MADGTILKVIRLPMLDATLFYEILHLVAKGQNLKIKKKFKMLFKVRSDQANLNHPVIAKSPFLVNYVGFVIQQDVEVERRNDSK